MGTTIPRNPCRGGDGNVFRDVFAASADRGALWRRYRSLDSLHNNAQFKTPSAEFGERFMSSPAQTSPVEAQPLIAVRDVRASSRWYAELLGADPLPDHAHRDVYDRIWRSGRLLLQLHAWDAEEHPNLVNADAAPPGHGVLLWFQVGDFDAAVERARKLEAEIIAGPLFNPAPGHREIWLRDPDSYVVVLAGPDGESTS
jgi:catechol 2,3-dioxygenase-like lactoylglutathione lyase family enzyme